MATFTFNNPHVCIFQDDLDALNVLYPTCGTRPHPQYTTRTVHLPSTFLAPSLGVHR